MVILIRNSSNNLIDIFEKLNKKDVSFHITYKENKDIVIQIPEDCDEDEQEMTFEQFLIAAIFSFKHDLGDIIILQINKLFNDKTTFNYVWYVDLSRQLLDFFFSYEGLLDEFEDIVIHLDSPISINLKVNDVTFDNLDGFTINNDGVHKAIISTSSNQVSFEVPIGRLNPRDVYQAFCQINRKRKGE